MEHDDTEEGRGGPAIAAPPTPAAKPPANNILNQLRDKRRTISRDRRLDLEVEGYDGALVVRYKPIDWDVVMGIVRKTEESRNPKKELIAQCRLLVQACDMFLVTDTLGNLIPMHEVPDTPEFEGEPVTWATDALDLALDLVHDDDGNELPPPRTSAERVLRVFRNEIAVAAHHRELTEWLEKSRVEADEDFSTS